MGAPRPMTVDELLKHPEYDHTIWDLKPERKEKLAVAKDRGGPIDIAYEVHGHGPRHMVVGFSRFSSLPELAFLPHPILPKQAHTKPTFVMPEKIPQSFSHLTVTSTSHTPHSSFPFRFSCIGRLILRAGSSHIPYPEVFPP
jgi:hypothetical protein